MLSKRAIVNAVIKEWSWLVPSGMPDATDPKHLEILRSVLTEEFNISKYETDQFIFLLQEKRTYKNNAQNRALGRVGLPYGSKGTPPGKEDKKELSPAEKKAKDKEEKEAKKLKDKQEQIAAKTKESLDQVAWESEEDRAQFETSLDKITSGEKVSKKELAMLNKYAKIKASDSEVAIYMSNGEVGDFRQGRRVKVELGGSANARKVKQQMLDAGMEEAAAITSADSVPPKIGGKQLTLGKMAKGRRRKEEVTKKKNEDGSISEVTVGGHTMRRQKMPDKKALVSEITELKKIKPKLSADEIKHKVAQTEAAIKRYNKIIDQYEDIDEVESVDLVEGADTSTPEGREKIAKEGPGVVADAVEEALGENPTTAEKRVVSDLRALGDIEDPEEYEKECLRILKEMGKVESMRKGAPDLAESLVMMAMNKRGIPAMAPAGETVKVADLIVFPEKDLDPNDPDYVSNLAQGGETIVMMTDAGGLSVKLKGGAASGFQAKLGLTTFKNEDTGGHLQNILDMHNGFMGTTKKGGELTQDSIDEGQGRLDATEQWAREQELVSDDDMKFKDGRSPTQWAEDSITDWESKGMFPKPPGLTEENKALMLAGLEQYARGGLLAQAIHNNDLDFQDYGNANANTVSGEIEMSDGIECVNDMAFTANPGFKVRKDKNGNFVMRPNSVYAGNLHRKCR